MAILGKVADLGVGFEQPWQAQRHIQGPSRC